MLLTNDELNELVAERLLGWKKGHVCTTPPGLLDHSYCVWKTGEGEDFKTQRFLDWNPAEKIADAFVVLEAWRQTGKFCCIEICSDYDYVWGVHWVRSFDADGMHCIGSEHKKESLPWSAEELPRLICLSALQANGYNVVEEK